MSRTRPRMMKPLMSSLLACVLAFGAPGVLAQSAFAESTPSNVDAVAQAEPAQSEPAAHERLEPVQNEQPPHERLLSQGADQALYKGVVGNMLEAVPMDAEQRVALQRANAVVGSPFSVRSIALLVGITNPVVMIGGLLWGLWAASRIESPKAEPPRPVAKAEPVPATVEVAAELALR
jgi:hypothetical protein